MDFIKSIQEKAKARSKKIVLPESEDERILKAASFCQQEGIANIVLLGEKEKLAQSFQKLELSMENIEIINPKNSSKIKEYVEVMLKTRAKKGLTNSEALNKITYPLVYSTLMLRCEDADGVVAGASHNTSEVIRTGLHYVPIDKEASIISGLFFVFVTEEFGEKGLLGMADCAVNPDPNSSQLAKIALSSAKTMESLLGIKARIGFLSFSTKGSAQHSLVKKISEATFLAQKLKPDLMIDGELQLDAAIVPEVAKKKASNSKIQGNANLLIFPDLNSGNIGYKLVQRIGKYPVVGPILQGFSRPINDLSRGCTVEEIILMITITALQ